MFRPLLLISFCSGRNGQNILYRHENRYHNTPHSTSDQISAYFGVFQPFLPISAEIHISTGTRFWLKKKKKKSLPPSSSGFQTLLLLVFFFFFFFFLFFSFSSGGFQTHLLLFFLPVGFGPANLLFFFYLCVVQVNGDVFWLFVSLLYSSLKCYVLCFEFFVCFASPRDTLLWVPSCHLCFKIWIFFGYVFMSPTRLTIKILNRMFNLNPLPLFHLLILSINIWFFFFFSILLLLLYFINDWTDTYYYYYYLCLKITY